MSVPFRVSLAFVALGAVLVAGVPLLTQQKFDPTEFESPNCKGKLNCFGLSAESAKDVEKVPEDPSTGIRHRGLPSRVDLSAHLPPVGSQGRLGSCVGWSTTYYLKTMHEQKEHKWRLNAGPGNRDRCNSGASRVFSPTWTYNQIGPFRGGRCRGTSIANAMRLMVSSGASTCSSVPYTVKDCQTQPNSAARSEAARYKAKSYARIPCEQRDAIKSVLAKGWAVTGGFRVTKDMYNLGSSGVWDSFDGNVRGGHAMTVVGYDDNKRSGRGHRGAFKFVNSWGTNYGQNGFGHISYQNWMRVCKYIYVMYDQRGGGGGGNQPTPQEPVTPQPKPTENTVGAPSNVSASRGTYPDRILVTWNGGTGAVAYMVQRSVSGGSFQNRGYTRSTNYADTSVQSGVAYRYRVISVGRSSSSSPDASPVAEGYAQQQTASRPGKVTGLNASVQQSGSRVAVSISWNPTPGATSYTVMRHDAKRNRWGMLRRSQSSTDLTDSRAPTGTVVNYAVRAVNSAGHGAFAVTQVEVGGKTRKPGQVTGIRATRGTQRGSILVLWNETPGAAGYYVARYNPSTRQWRGVGRTGGVGFVDRSSQAGSGRPFYYSVVAFNSNGPGDPGRPAVGYAQRGSFRGKAPEVPDSLEVSQSGKSVTIKWKAAKNADEYYVFRKEKDAAKFKFVASTGSKLTFTDTIPKTGKLYLYTVRAKSALGGESADADPVAAFVNEEVPLVKRRFLPGQGFDKVGGIWKAVHLTDEDAHKLRLELRSDGGSFTARLFRDGKETGKTTGKFAANSSSLEAGGFSLELAGDDAAVVRIDDRRLYPQTLRLVFTR